MVVDPNQLLQPPVAAPVDQPVVFDVAAVAEENARLRAELLAENERLRAALADSQASGLTFAGLSDEEVRRLEHPEEFVAEENARFATQLAELQRQLDQVTQTPNAPGFTGTSVVSPATGADVTPPADPFAGVSDADLQAALDARKSV